MGLILMPVLLILGVIGGYAAGWLLPDVSTSYAGLSGGEKFAYYGLRIFAFIGVLSCAMKVMDEHFPSANTGFTNNLSAAVFLLTPILLGVFWVLTKIVVIKLFV